MKKKRCCNRCKRIFLITRNPAQHYCSQADCQRVRYNQWRKNLRSDKDYQSNQRSAQKRWQTRHTDYWKQYRASHRNYVIRNREQQRIRDCNAKKRVRAREEDLAKSNSLNALTPVNTGDCWLIPLHTENLAKSNSLFVQIAVKTRDCEDIALL